MTLFDLSGAVAVVTGSSRGIGRASAERLAEAGARVVISSRKVEACEAVATGIRAAGGEALVVPCNISSDGQLATLVERTLDHWGRIDVLVCNAASNPLYGPLADVDAAAFDKVMHNNVRSSLTLCNHVIPQMATRGDGSVVLISSVTGLAGNRKLGLYGMSKAADMQLVRNLAVEWGPSNVRINAIAPGLIKTDFARALWQDPRALDYVNRSTPLGRIGEPDDIAGVVVFLASQAARFLTGQTLIVDGGVTVADRF